MSGRTVLACSASSAADALGTGGGFDDDFSGSVSGCGCPPARSRSWLGARIGRANGRADGQAHGRAEEGSGAVDLIVVTTIVVSLLLLAVGLGRVRSADQLVSSAAADGARAASLQRTATGAQQAAEQTVASSLITSQTSCAAGPAVSVDVSRWRPGGSVSVTVACTAALADLTAPGLPGNKTLTAHATSPIDSRRSAAT